MITKKKYVELYLNATSEELDKLSYSEDSMHLFIVANHKNTSLSTLYKLIERHLSVAAAVIKNPSADFALKSKIIELYPNSIKIIQSVLDSKTLNDDLFLKLLLHNNNPETLDFIETTVIDSIYFYEYGIEHSPIIVDLLSPQVLLNFVFNLKINPIDDDCRGSLLYYIKKNNISLTAEHQQKLLLLCFNNDILLSKED